MAVVDFADFGGEELDGSPEGTGSANGMAYVRRGQIPWNQILPFYAALFPSVVSGIPQLPSQFPGIPCLYADSLVHKPIFDDDTVIDYGPPNIYRWAYVEVQYKTQAYGQSDPSSPSSSQIISRRRSFSNQLLTLPNVGLKWADTGKVITDPEATASKMVGLIRHEITFHKLLNVPWNTIRFLQGKANSTNFEGASPECLLFDGTDIAEAVSVGATGIATTIYDVTLVFLEHNLDGTSTVTWNHKFDPVKGKWRKVVRADNSGGIYLTGNFNLFH